MKERISSLIVFCLSLILILCICACGKKEEKKEVPSQVATESQPEASEAATESDSGEAEPDEIASNLIDKLNTLNKIYSCGLDRDTDIQYVDPDSALTYFYVTDPEFNSFGAISKFLDENFTWDFSNKYYPELASPGQSSPPIYVYVQDENLPEGLYMINGGKGFSVYDPNAAKTFENVQDKSFTVSLPYDFFGQTESLTLDIINDGAAWKINEKTDSAK